MKHIQALTRNDIIAANGQRTSGMMDVGGRKLYVETYGSIQNPAIAFLHGGPGTSCVEQEDMSVLLSQNFFVVSFDQYGVFRSEDIPEDETWGMKEHVALIERLRETLQIQKWALLGHSYGGMLVCYYTHLCPASVSASLYENPSWDFILSLKSIVRYFIENYFNQHPDETAGRAFADAMRKEDYSTHPKDAVFDILELQKYVADKRVTMYMHSIDLPDYFSIFDRCYQALEADEDAVDQKCLYHTEKLIDGPEFFENHMLKIPENRAPALLLVGKYDPVCTAEQIEFFRKNAPIGEVVILPNSAHHPRIEDRELYASAVIDFMQRFVGA